MIIDKLRHQMMKRGWKVDSLVVDFVHVKRPTGMGPDHSLHSGNVGGRHLRDALARLTALGHWRIVIPLCDRAEPFKRSIRNVTRKAVEATGHVYLQSYHNPESSFKMPDVTWRILEASFAANPPTALVFLDWRELVTAQCYLLRMGLEVPENVSLVLLSFQAEAEWFIPKLFHFRFPIRRFLNVILRWLEREDDLPALQPLRADLVEGESVASPDPASRR